MGATGISANRLLSQIRVYPNPAKDELNLIFENTEIADGTRIELVNSTGSVVLKKDILHKYCKLDISSLPSGVYVLKIIRNGAFSFRKIVQ